MSSQRPEPELQQRIIDLAERSLATSVREVQELAPGLGRRRFFRLRLEGDGPGSIVARVEAPAESVAAAMATPPEPPLEPLRRFLADHGLPVPASHGTDAEAGIDLLEDLGTRSLESAAGELPPEERSHLYARACELVPRLQSLSESPEAIPAFGRRLDAALIATKATKFVEWALPGLRSRPTSSAERHAVFGAFEWIARQCADAPARLAHRDFKAANLQLRAAARGGDELVMIDLQGAFLAPPEYDLVCLLKDSHVSLTEGEVEGHLERIRPLLPDAPDREIYGRRFTLLTLIRVGKDIAHYLHAARDRGDDRYMRFVPTGLRNLRASATRAADWHGDLARLADLIHSLPEPRPPRAEHRGGPECGQ